jgi:predicted dehydrogenase
LDRPSVCGGCLKAHYGNAVRLGLIGVGRWGRNYVRTIAALGQVNLVAAATNNPESRELLPADCRITRDWYELIRASDVDGVIIASPPSSHAEMLVAAIEEGKPALIEKPVTQSRKDVDRIRAALNNRKAILIVDHIHLFHPAFRALQREALELGPIRSIKSSAGNYGPYRADVPVLWDWAPHDLAMCLTLVPGPARPLRAVQLAAQPMAGALAERLSLQVELCGPVLADVQLSTLDPRHRWFAVTVESCSLVYRDFGPEKLVRLSPGIPVSTGSGSLIPVDEEPPLTRVVLEFAHAIQTGDASMKSIDLGLSVVNLISEIEFHLDRTLPHQ